MQDFWNQRYAEPGYKYGTEPNAFLRETASRLSPAGQVLVPGDGEGRNSVWLAAQGHQVLAVDLAEVGLAKARQLALAQGAEVSARLGVVLGVVRILVADLLATDMLESRAGRVQSSTDVSLLERVVDGLKAL